ncbi:uncharacterized protein [Rutidosis leptorrhynchoides]|uniref:uncharacterized protein n=1 Tax=Rutidosis leptorrhynchoides TaxID=125765 RepID=UPI003A9A420A
MPRPGPRPYECVRRAWHSDRHQPMRGSLIQEIFRVVNEIHSSTTRKNKEWQDKLPIVVLKAEEIMYSKANSEAEYMDLETLWDRANDAINTIIRLDETTETGDFLQPCIEAALNLGCTPMRTSRSQRNNTTYYLNTRNTEPNSCPSNNLQKITQETMTIPPLVPHFSHITKPRNINSSPFNVKPQVPILPYDKSLKNKFCFPSSPNTKNVPSVYPLYKGNGVEFKEPKISNGAPSEPYGELKENGEMGFSLSFCNGSSKKVTNQSNLRYTNEEHTRVDECDLSLRLGPSQQSQPRDMAYSHSSKKQKAVVSNFHQNLQFGWQPNVSSAKFNGGSFTNAESYIFLLSSTDYSP